MLVPVQSVDIPSEGVFPKRIDLLFSNPILSLIDQLDAKSMQNSRKDESHVDIGQTKVLSAYFVQR
jgi:hypothetical protein